MDWGISDLMFPVHDTYSMVKFLAIVKKFLDTDPTVSSGYGPVYGNSK